MAKSACVERVSQSYPASAQRSDAGRAPVRLIDPAPDPDAVVLALPRGGVSVGHPLARALGARLVPMPVRKLPIPHSPEMGFGAVTLDGAVRAQAPASLTMAVPVAAPGSPRLVTPLLDAAYCLIEQEALPFAVASFYREFLDLTGDEVIVPLGSVHTDE